MLPDKRLTPTQRAYLAAWEAWLRSDPGVRDLWALDLRINCLWDVLLEAREETP